MSCYQGDLIEELQLASCSEFQRWLVQVRNEWRQRVIRFAEQVLELMTKRQTTCWKAGEPLFRLWAFP